MDREVGRGGGVEWVRVMRGEVNLAHGAKFEYFFKNKIDVFFFADDDDLNQPLMQAYPPAPVPEKLIDQPIPSEST